jgi:hypothetical protein
MLTLSLYRVYGHVEDRLLVSLCSPIIDGLGDGAAFVQTDWTSALMSYTARDLHCLDTPMSI